MKCLLRAAAALAAGLFAAGTPALAEDDPDFLTFQVGAYDLIQDSDMAGAFALEYKSDAKLWIVKPFGGAMVTTDGALHGYGGILTDIYFGRRIVLQFGFAPGFYIDGNGRKLGYPLEFRSHGELAFRFDDRSRIGLMVNHISNADIGDKNPGTEVLMLSYSVPVRSILGE